MALFNLLNKISRRTNLEINVICEAVFVSKQIFQEFCLNCIFVKAPLV